MAYTTLISTADLAENLGDPDWAVVDCRFSLGDPPYGQAAYRKNHIPGAVYAHLDEDLSSPIVPGKTGRHPLPDPDDFARTLSSWGINRSVQVVAYDDAGGLYAGRLWWMLRWLGHDAVALLDGDWRTWQSEGRSVASGREQRVPRHFVPHLQREMAVDADQVLAALQDSDTLVVDVRSADRYRGENETIDPRAGHIAGAVSAPYGGNLGPDGRFLSAQELRTRYEALLGDSPVENAIFYCGSGVSAAHDLLAMVHAGVGMARLYVGSWSDWINDPSRPMATGPQP